MDLNFMRRKFWSLLALTSVIFSCSLVVYFFLSKNCNVYTNKRAMCLEKMGLLTRMRMQCDTFNCSRSGQGTLSLELLEQAPDIDTLIVPISGLFNYSSSAKLSISSFLFLHNLYYRFLFVLIFLIQKEKKINKIVGGGLVSGVALAAKSINPAIRVLAAEPRGANDAAQSKAAGRIITLPETNTIADGLRAFLGDCTWPIVRDLVDDIITVDDKEIIEAMKLCYEILKVVVEPSGAIGLAAVLSDSFKKNPALKNCSNIGIILSGGNVDLGGLWDSFRK
ncbi:hypothetical protein FH972_012158 [Carpinus fangiana]|uniref:Tryptophan synthase beta chain-like PALP domain-containing protein n=1 Tax=Carpinus fangiana TaxID=176857 RepID=A0A5N6R3T6_9ROSI|nr:hypothetical protein FH972_012158 [Carpinus fangiana]